MKSKGTAAIFALLLGGLGAHKFYLGKIVWGIVYLVFSFTFIPLVISIFEGIGFIAMSGDKFDSKYNQEYINKRNYEAQMLAGIQKIQPMSYEENTYTPSPSSKRSGKTINDLYQR